MSFDSIKEEFAPIHMRIPPNNLDEMLLMPTSPERLVYGPAPTKNDIVMVVDLPKSETSAKQARYLWVLTTTDAPHALEICMWGASLASKVVKHSNLTGGEPAYMGGELWFVSENCMIINFCSGRYGAITEADLVLADAIVNALVADGYKVATTGRDIESDYPSSRVLIGDPIYQNFAPQGAS